MLSVLDSHELASRRCLLQGLAVMNESPTLDLSERNDRSNRAIHPLATSSYRSHHLSRLSLCADDLFVANESFRGASGQLHYPA